MKIRKIRIHNIRSIRDAEVELTDFSMLVGANNAGKSNFLLALRLFYENVKWSQEDAPKFEGVTDESWIEIVYQLDTEEWDLLAEKHKNISEVNTLTVRRYFISSEHVKTGQSNIYSVVNGIQSSELFYGAKNISTAKLGELIYIPASINPADQLKTSGPSPFREIVSFIFKKYISSSEAFQSLSDSFEKLNDEAKSSSGFLSQISDPLNKTISNWGVKFSIDINKLNPDDITKNLLSTSFADSGLGDQSLSIDKFGHGFQRTFLYELIRIAPQFFSTEKRQKKDFSPDFTLIIFEEPEVFLHPSQQEIMTYNLRMLSKNSSQQIIISTHSPIFIGKASDDICQIIKVHKKDGISFFHQIGKEEINSLFSYAMSLLEMMKIYLQDECDNENERNKLNKIISKSDFVDEDFEKFRYQLWLDSDRAGMFFANKVLLVEGATERAIFNWLLARDWYNLSEHRIAIIDVLGKYNFHRFAGLLDKFRIPYGIMADDDGEKNDHKFRNKVIRELPGISRLSDPVFIPGCMEDFLGIEKIEDKSRADLKPVFALISLENKAIKQARLAELHDKFQLALKI